MKRNADFSIDKLFIERWSPRAMSGEEISDQELMSLFESARWAPSSYNNQPWRFIYAKRNTPHWQTFYNLLVPFNQSWAKNAAVLIVIASFKLFSTTKKPSRTHSFDTGAAWENLALQGFLNGLVVHGMEGFDYERAQKELQIPKDYQVEAVCAVGRPGNISELPLDLQKREELSDRKKVNEFVFEGLFKEKL